jgi:autotransporter strand-loop-strand O-heptosyltransferase
MPYIEEFRKKHNCKLVASTFWNKFFQSQYPEIEFVEPGSTVHNLYGLYKIGWFYDKDNEPKIPNVVALQKTATNILGLEFKEIKPNIDFTPLERSYEEKYITIATNSTAGCKFWTKEGWQELINYLHNKGYKIINVSKEDNPFDNVTKLQDTSIENTMNVIHHSELFIGLSSGLSWLAWALGKHVVMISNFTEPNHEFISNCTRIYNHSVCNSCWNDPDFVFDKGDWDWCPKHKGTDRQFECHTSIKSEQVINQIKFLI